MILIKSFLTGILYDCFKRIYASLNEGDKVRECYSCWKMMIQSHLQVGFSLNVHHFMILFIYETVAFKRNFKTKKIMKCLAITIFV